jgi:hypothetical protein
MELFYFLLFWSYGYVNVLDFCNEVRFCDRFLLN